MKFAWLKQMFTESDNSTIDLKRVGFAFITGLWGSVGGYAVVMLHQAFNWQDAALGGAALLGSLGVSIMTGVKGEAKGEGDKQ
jgi:hypothetical protein